MSIGDIKARFPYWQSPDGSVLLVQGDCLEVLPMIEAGTVNLVCTDPPYGVRDDEWDAMSEVEFVRLSLRWISACLPISQECVAFGTCGGAVERIMRMAYPMVRQMVWHKPKGSQYNGAKFRASACVEWYTMVAD